MNRVLYMAGEWVVVWLLLFGLGAGMLWVWDADAGLKQLFLLGWALASAITAGKWVLVGSRPLRGLLRGWGGFYNPARPIAALTRAGWFEREDADRAHFHWPYHDTQGRDPFEVVAQVSAELRRQGIEHTHLGYIGVIDGPAYWRVEPALAGAAVEGWVQAEQPEDREQILNGLRAVLTDVLSLQLAASRR